MSRPMRKNVLCSIVIAISLYGCGTKQKAESMRADTNTFHESILTIDSHVDTPLRIMHDGVQLGVYHDPLEWGSKLDLPRMKSGGLDIAFFAVWTAQHEPM